MSDLKHVTHYTYSAVQLMKSFTKIKRESLYSGRLCYDTVQSIGKLVTFLRNILRPFSGFLYCKWKHYSSETMVSDYQTAQLPNL
jgi:hypothetical protein